MSPLKIGDSSSIIDTSVFYIDGVETATVLGEGKSYPIDEQFFIGTTWDSSGEFFSVVIDDISIWDRKLSSNEISSIYNSGIGLDPTIDSLMLAKEFSDKNNISNINFINADIFDDVLKENVFDFIW